MTSHRFDPNTGGNFRAGYFSAQDARVALRRHLAPLALGGDNISGDVRLIKRWLRTFTPDVLVSAQGNLHRVLVEGRWVDGASLPAPRRH